MFHNQSRSVNRWVWMRRPGLGTTAQPLVPGLIPKGPPRSFSALSEVLIFGRRLGPPAREQPCCLFVLESLNTVSLCFLSRSASPEASLEPQEQPQWNRTCFLFSIATAKGACRTNIPSQTGNSELLRATTGEQ